MRIVGIVLMLTFVVPPPPALGAARRDVQPEAAAQPPRQAQRSQPTHDAFPLETVEDCMGIWDKGSHMTKAEWRRACQRTANRMQRMQSPSPTMALPAPPSGTAKGTR